MADPAEVHSERAADLRELSRRSAKVVEVLPRADPDVAQYLVDNLNVDAVRFGLTGSALRVTGQFAMESTETLDPHTTIATTTPLKYVEGDPTREGESAGYTLVDTLAGQVLMYRISSRLPEPLTRLSTFYPIEHAQFTVLDAHAQDPTPERSLADNFSLLADLPLGKVFTRQLKEFARHHRHARTGNEAAISDIGMVLTDMMADKQVASDARVETALTDLILMLVRPGHRYTFVGHSLMATLGERGEPIWEPCDSIVRGAVIKGVCFADDYIVTPGDDQKTQATGLRQPMFIVDASRVRYHVPLKYIGEMTDDSMLNCREAIAHHALTQRDRMSD